MQTKDVQDNGQDNNAADEPKTNQSSSTEDVQGLKERLEKLEGLYTAAVEDSKRHQSKYRKLRDEREAEEAARLEGQQKYKELADNYKAKADEQAKALLKRTLDLEVAKYATDANDVDLVIKALPVDLVEVDQDTMSVSGVKDAIDKLRQDKAFLFKSKDAPGMVNSRPRTNKPQEKSLSDLSIEEKLGLLSKGFGESLKR